MIFALATAALSATTVYSQATSLSPETIATAGLQQLSSECRSAILSLAVSPLTECLGVSALAPAISANASLVPILDNWMETICAAEPCDQELLDSTAQNFSSACNDDFAKYDVSGTDIQDIVGMYPLVRELVCLKTTEPFVSNSTMNSTMTETNSTSANTTEEDTFCVTSLLTEVSDYLGMNLTVNSIFDLVLGSDTEGRQALTELPPTALCQDCIYAGAGLIEQQYPGIWNETITGNFTIGGFLNSTCVNETFPEIDMESNNTITLPETVYPSAENSTYAYPIMYMNGTTNETYTPSETVQQPPSIPFLNFPPADVEGGVPAPTAFTSLTGPEATSSAAAPMTSATDMASSAVASATAPVVSAVSVASSAAPAAPTKRDVTAAKRRWVGQQ